LALQLAELWALQSVLASVRARGLAATVSVAPALAALALGVQAWAVVSESAAEAP
jgi:hypothetical protein